MTAVITLTKAAADVGSCIREQIPDAVLYVQARYGKDFPAAEIIDGKLPLFVKGLWDAYSRLIFIMAAGIVVRMIAPLLSSKTEDPAVVVLDEKGQCVISLLAGHWGGANELAREIAAGLGALPVITTATDVEGLPAWDELARRNGCTLENSGHLKKITGLMLDGQTVAVYHSVKLTVSLPDHVLILENRSALPGINSGPHEYHALVQIGEELLEPRELGGLPCAVLRPRNLVIGVGCRRGTGKAEILQAVAAALRQAGLSAHSVACLVSAEIKKDEPGLWGAAAELDIPLRFAALQEIKALAGRFAESDFVRQKIGVGAVAEPAAWLAAREPVIIAPKTVYLGITVAIVKDNALVIT